MLLNLFGTSTLPKAPTPEEQIRLDDYEIAVNGHTVPVKIQIEPRFNNRVSVNANGVLIRLSARQSIAEKKRHIELFLHWAKGKIDKNPALLESLPQRKYVNGEILQVGQYEFTINIFYHDVPKSTAKIIQNQIILSIPRGLSKEKEDDTKSYLVTRCLCKYFTPIIAERVHELNRKYFGKTIESVRLKYNTTNWGSCSTLGNINISVRLMFAPDPVIDYVLIHELAHLVHHDHSPRFWKLVERIDPTYMDKEKHLSAYSKQYFL